MKNTLLRFVAVVCALAALHSSVSFAFNPPDEFMIGTTIHYYWNECMIEDSLNMMRQAGQNSYRGDYSEVWAVNKKPDGSCDPYPRAHEAAVTAKKYGVTPLLLLGGVYQFWPVGKNYPHYQNFCTSMVKAGKDVGGFFQIWNEWDGAHMMEDKSGKLNTAENYVELLTKLYPVLKKISPETPIMANSFCRRDDIQLYKCLDLGMQKYCDCYSIHTYNLEALPEEVYRDRLLRLHNKATECAKKQGLSQPKPFYVTEMSWYQSLATVSEETQGDYCARFYLLASIVPSCKGVYWYNFNERGSDYRDGSCFWGMTMRDTTPKQAFYALASVSKIIRKGKFVRRIDLGNPNYWMLEYKMPDGTYSLAAWTINLDERLHVVLEQKDAAKRTPFILERSGNQPLERFWGFRDHNCNPRKPTKQYDDQFSFHTTTRPMLLMGLKDGYSIKSVEPIVMRQPTKVVLVAPPAIAVVKEKGSTVVLNNDLQYRFIPNGEHRKGNADLSAKMTVSFDDKNLKLNIEVTDNVFKVVEEGDAYWNGDSIQLTFVPVEKGGILKPKDFLDIMLVGDTKDGNLCLERRRSGPYGPCTCGAEFTFKKFPKPNVVVYELTVPLEKIGLNRKTMCDGTPFTMTMLVNDNDGKNRRGYLHWGNGIGGERQANLNGWLIFQE